MHLIVYRPGYSVKLTFHVIEGIMLVRAVAGPAGADDITDKSRPCGALRGVQLQVFTNSGRIEQYFGTPRDQVVPKMQFKWV
jgi:hypothetical protein